MVSTVVSRAACFYLRFWLAGATGVCTEEVGHVHNVM